MRLIDSFKKNSRKSPADRCMMIGALFQVPMICLFGVILMIYANEEGIAFWLTAPGAALFLYCLWVLYFRRGRTKGLITTGPFRFTRHPMYVGFFVMSLATWIPAPTQSLSFFALYGLFLALMIAAGYWQERETVARFGQDAAEYYSHTPRLPFLI